MKQSHILAVAGIVMLILFYITSTSREGLETGSCSSGTVKTSTLFNGGELANITGVASATECGTKCCENPSCTGYTYNSSNKMCHLKSGTITEAGGSSNFSGSTVSRTASAPAAPASTSTPSATMSSSTSSTSQAAAASTTAPPAAAATATQTGLGMSPTLAGAAKSVGDTATSTYNSFGAVISSGIAKFGLVLVVGASIVIGVIVVWALWNTFIGRPATAAPPGLAPMIGAPPARWY